MASEFNETQEPALNMQLADAQDAAPVTAPPDCPTPRPRNPFVLAAESLMSEAASELDENPYLDFYCSRKRGNEYTMFALALARDGPPLTICALAPNAEVNDVTLLIFTDAMLEALSKTPLKPAGSGEADADPEAEATDRIAQISAAHRRARAQSATKH
jgi:hypothetical protein